MAILSIASDYAVLKTKYARFYYGYEITLCPVHGKMCDCEDQEWCFEAYNKEGNRHTTIPSSKLGTEDSFDCVECLLLGIGKVIDDYYHG